MVGLRVQRSFVRRLQAYRTIKLERLTVRQSNMHSRDKRAREVQNAIREVLIREWDPIHIQDVPEAQDEYDGYVGGVYRLLAGGA